MLHTIGKNWATDCVDREKNGMFFIHDRMYYATAQDMKPHIEEILQTRE